MKKLLMLVGPQGSGNHIFARMLSLHPEVFGWKSLQDHYFLKHGFESFAEFYSFPHLLTQERFEKEFGGSEYYFGSCSYPYVFQGYIYNPKILEFCQQVASFGIDVTIAVVVRDDTITRLQQSRVRAKETIELAKHYVTEVLVPSEFPVHFISLESFFSYKTDYMKYLAKILNFPIDYDNPDILKFITESPNNKYITPIKTHWLDSQNQQGATLLDLSNPEYLFRGK